MRDELDAVVRGGMERFRVPGVAAGIIDPGGELSAGFGVTNVEHPLPVDDHTLFRIASVTKTFVGTAVMALVEQGTLDLEAPVRTWLPGFRTGDEAASGRILLRHLLTHTAGFAGDWFGDQGHDDEALARTVSDLANAPQLTPPGEVWSYSNAGFLVAGRILEVVTGTTFEQAITDLVLRAAGMSHTTFFADDVVTHGVAAGHYALDGPPRVVRPWGGGRSGNPAGGLISCLRDLMRYASFHLGRTEGPLGPRGLARMRDRWAEAGNDADAVGIAWMLRDLEGGTIAEHGGTLQGQHARVTLVPGRGSAVVVLSNTEINHRLDRTVVGWALDRRGLREREPGVYVPPRERLAEYEGSYHTTLRDTRVRTADDGLLLHATHILGISDGQVVRLDVPAVRLRFTGPDRVVALDEPFVGDRGEFLRRPDGRIAWFRWGGRMARPVPSDG